MENVEQLFRRYYSKMLLIAKMMLGDEDEARDLVSDVFAEMLNGKLKVLPGCSEAYFVVMVRNRCLNLLRKKTTQDKVRKCLIVDSNMKTMSDECCLMSKIEQEIDQEMDKLDEMLRFMEHDLTPQTSRIMNMHYRQKKTYRQIAAELHVSEAAVYKHLAQGIKRIKEHFNPQKDGED